IVLRSKRRTCGRGVDWSGVSFFARFFFQAEDGIRAGHVTGVQTCALPIAGIVNPNVEKQGANHGHNYLQSHSAGTGAYMVQNAEPNNQIVLVRNPHYWGGWSGSHFKKIIILQIGRASCRERERGARVEGWE